MVLRTDVGGDGRRGGRCVSFNLMLSELDKDMLGAVAAKRRVSQGQVVRDLIVAGYMMMCEAQPVCATGAGCLVAHMHHRAGQEPHLSTAPSADPMAGVPLVSSRPRRG